MDTPAGVATRPRRHSVPVGGVGHSGLEIRADRELGHGVEMALDLRDTAAERRCVVRALRMRDGGVGFREPRLELAELDLEGGL